MTKTVGKRNHVLLWALVGDLTPLKGLVLLLEYHAHFMEPAPAPPSGAFLICQNAAPAGFVLLSKTIKPGRVGGLEE
jgi:hypothetical protein